MKIVVACEVVLIALKNIKAEIYAIQHKAYSRKQGHVCHFSEKGQVNVMKVRNIRKFEQKCLNYENVLKKCRWLHVIIACNKLLEKALEQVARHWCFPNVWRNGAKFNLNGVYWDHAIRKLID